MATVGGRPRLVPFTPTAADPEELGRRTVGRGEVLDHLLEGARAATRGRDRAHTLLVAPRGGGKTHVLTLFVHRLRSDEQFVDALAVVVIAEDAVEIASHADLLVAVIDELGTDVQRDSARVLRRDGKRAELERLVLAVLDGRPLVLVVENLDRVFAELRADGQRQLRAFVETSRAVMLVASTPALFHGVRSRTEPWFGSFAVERLVPWSVDEGTAFLELVARERGDMKLAGVIASPIGRARLTAVEGLVGGLPRLWTILAGCITVDLLDELVPLVLSTLEELVPYYQARLNELSASERKLVVALCQAETLGSRSGRTVRELALAAGVPEGSAPKLLKRLEDASWVVPTKPPGTDRRATWYEIREPLLRYHVVYRRQAGEPLALIVSFLRAWFSPSERRQHLVGTVAGSTNEHAYHTGTAGDHARARDLYTALIDDHARILGPDQRHTLTARHNHAYETGAAGDHACARDLYAALIDDRTRILGPDHPDTLSSRTVALEFIHAPAAKRDAALSLLSRPCPAHIATHARRVLDGLFARPGADAHEADQDRAALPHLLAASRPGPGLVALAKQASSTRDIAPVLVAATGDDPAKLSSLTTAIVEALGRSTWTRSQLVAWLDAWTVALIDRPSAEVPRSILDIVRREADGDATARPSLPPELRSILPPIRFGEDAD